MLTLCALQMLVLLLLLLLLIHDKRKSLHIQRKPDMNSLADSEN